MSDADRREGARETVIGPALPPHIAARAGEVIEADNATGPATQDGADTPPPRRVLGPTMPPSRGEEEPRLSAAAQAFLEREKRMKEASERPTGAAAQEGSSRPEWMLALPTAKSFSETIEKDQSAALKNRGFSQAQNMRVQKGRGGAGLGGMGEEDSSLWTETPKEREKRLMEEELGIRPKGADVVQAHAEEEAKQGRADREREELVQKAIREHDAARGPSLLEQHQAKRRTEVRGKNRDRGPESSSSKLRERGEDSDSQSSTDRRRRRHKRRQEDTDRDGRSDRRRERDRYDKRRARDASASDTDSEEERRLRKHSSGTRTHDGDDDGRHRHHRPSHRSASQERERRRQKEEKEREREKKEKRREKRKEEKGEKKGAPMMVWDREAAMSVGGKLMDDQKRMDTIRSSASLGSRFGGGSSRYL